MNSLPEIIRAAQKDLYCPTCGRNFTLGEIRVRGMFEHTVLLQTLCANGHVPIIMIFVASINAKQYIRPIKSDDVLKAHVAIKDFDGDFIALWKNNSSK